MRDFQILLIVHLGVLLLLTICFKKQGTKDINLLLLSNGEPIMVNTLKSPKLEMLYSFQI